MSIVIAEGQEDVHVARLDASARKLVEPPRRLTRNDAVDRSPSWLPERMSRCR